jgi:hypothetical protein
MRKFIKLSSETQSAAKWCYQRGIKGNVGDRLPPNLSARSCLEIDNNPILFRLAIHMNGSF